MFKAKKKEPMEKDKTRGRGPWYIIQDELPCQTD